MAFDTTARSRARAARAIANWSGVAGAASKAPIGSTGGGFFGGQSPWATAPGVTTPGTPDPGTAVGGLGAFGQPPAATPPKAPATTGNFWGQDDHIPDWAVNMAHDYQSMPDGPEKLARYNHIMSTVPDHLKKGMLDLMGPPPVGGGV